MNAINFDWTLISERGELEIDFNYIHARKTHGEITVMLTWNFAVEPGAVPEAVLLLCPTRWDTEAEEGPTVCAVLLSEAWRWSRTHNRDREMLGHWSFGRPPTSDNWQKANATYYAMLLGLSAHEERTVNRIRGLIEDYLDDLTKVPPPPSRDKRPEATFEVIDLNSGRTSEMPVKLD